MFLETFELLEEFRKIKPFKIEFREGINVIVGENGSGKSTLLRLLTDSKFLPDKIKLDYKKGTEFSFLDTEKDNPRMKDIRLQEKHYSFAVHSHFVSHGQIMFPLVDAIKNFKDKVVFIDEPESGISLSNQKKLFKSFKKAALNNCQIVLTTHSYIFINSIETVFSLDSKKWVLSKDYLGVL